MEVGKQRERGNNSKLRPRPGVPENPQIREGCDLPLGISHRGPALCQSPPKRQDPGFLQTTRHEVAAGPRTWLPHTWKNMAFNPTPSPSLPGPACPGASEEGWELPQSSLSREVTSGPSCPHPCPPSPYPFVLNMQY